MVRRLFVLALLSLVAILSSSSLARADATIDAIADILRAEAVYNDPVAELSLTTGQVTALQQQITDTGLPIFIAVLPEEDVTAYGSADALLSEIQASVGRDGVYAMVAGNSFRAGSTSGSVRQIADTAFAQNSANGVYAVLQAFVAGVDAQFNDSAAANNSSGSGAQSSPTSSGSGIPILIPLVVLVVLGGIGFVFLRRRGKKQQAQRLDTVRAVLNEDVTELGERLGSFDLTDSRLDEAGRADLQKALDAYSAASDSTATASSDADITAATGELEKGRYALACVEARMDGRPEPAHRAPCFVDPRHGPSVDDIDWAPQGGAAHPVPVCAACENTINSGGRPTPREVDAGGQRVPYWQGGPAYAPYARGYYRSWSDIVPALFIGTMLASTFAAPAAQAAPPMGQPGPDGTTFGGGDFGRGGGFGGGDFGGGGSFGGGDF